jgi:SAM-dependent MidA family methyltransferase
MLTTSLQQLIIDRIRSQGPLSFAEYMRMALYEPGHGYYVNDSSSSKLGWEGDFYTSTDVSDFFAHCMGRQLLHMWEQLRKPDPFVVLEQGAGRGDLARGIRAWAAQEAPAFLNVLEYHAEDINRGHDALQSSLEIAITAPTPHVILSNELVDAFPVHIVEKRDDKLYEVYVTCGTLHEDALSEMLDEPGSPEIAHYLDTYNIPWKTFADGWRAEINLDALRWIQRTARLLSGTTRPSTTNNGFLLTIDYGEEAQALYTPDLPHGTLACYYRHQLTERPLTRPGEQDITAHVNFTALMQEGERQGLRQESFTTQGQWLEAMGILDELASIRARDFAILDTDRGSDRGQVALFQWKNLRQQVAALTDPYGMGNFKVLILSA